MPGLWAAVASEDVEQVVSRSPPLPARLIVGHHSRDQLVVDDAAPSLILGFVS